MANEQHHDLGMSKWPMWAICPSYVGSSGGDSAQSGIRAHKHLENLLRARLDLEIEEEAHATPDEQDAAEWAYDKLCELAGDAAIEPERRVTICRHDSILNGIFGTADATWQSDLGVIHIADFKSLCREDKDYGPQLMGYAIAIMPEDTDLNEVIIGHILAAGSRQVYEYRFSLGDAIRECESIVKARRDLAQYIERKKSHWCATCGNLLVCPAHKGDIEIAKKMDVANIKGGDLLDLKHRLGQFVRAIDAEVKRRQEAGEALVCSDGSHYEQVERKTKVLSDLDGLAKCLLDGGVTRGELNAMVKVSRTAVIEAMIAHRDGLKKSTAEKVIAPFYTEVTSKTLKRIK